MSEGYNESTILNIDNITTGAKMFDKLSRLKVERRTAPLDQLDNIFYEHRYLYDSFNLQIGDTYFIIPPEFILVSSESNSQKMVTLRQENTQKLKSGYHKRIILIDLVFCGLNQLNGYEVEGPEGTYYVDGLRQLLAQFKCTPFLPINNEMINGTYGIFTVALQSITISTVEGYPDVMKAQLTLQEVNMIPYTEMPNIAFQYMIDWDLFRFYYQSFLTEKHVYRKLQSLPKNKEYSNFKISILDNEIFKSSYIGQSNMLDVICDKEILRKDENGNKLNTNYLTWLDSNQNNVYISSFQCGYSNLLTNIQLSDSSSPTLQFMGGMDTIYSITLETRDNSVVQAIEQCQISNDTMIRNNIRLRSVGFVKLESDLVAFTGSLFVIIESVTTSTVPDFPGLYRIQLNCVSYDIAQSKRESLNGFRPFECDNEECKSNNFEPTHVHKEQAITQDWNGLKTKIAQDNYAEWKLRTEIEVYPDLHLPTYKEVNDFISKCIKFRKEKELSDLLYTEYPRNPISVLHGNNPNTSQNEIQDEVNDKIQESQDEINSQYEGVLNGSLVVQNVTHIPVHSIIKKVIEAKGREVIYPSELNISNTDIEYNLFVDPDFYVFYPDTYESFIKEHGEDYYNYKPYQRSSFSKIKKTLIYADEEPSSEDGSTSSTSNSSSIEEFIQLALSFVGNTYVWGAEGEISDSKGLCFDCSGFVTYLLKAVGVMPSSQSRFTVRTIPNSDLFEEVQLSTKKRGDIICNTSLSHVVIYLGDNEIVHASNSSPYPKGGVKTDNYYFGSNARCFRVKAFSSSSASASNSSSSNTSGVYVTEEFLQMIKEWEGYYPNAVYQDGGIDIGYGFHNQYYNGTEYVDIKIGMTMSEEEASKYLKLEMELLIPKTIKKIEDNGWSVSDFTNNQILALTSYFFNRGYSNSKADAILDKSNNSTVEDIGNSLPNYWGSNSGVKQGLINRRKKEQQLFFSSSSGTISNGNTTSNGYVLSIDEYESICQTVYAETKGESSDSELAMAQLIYDMLTDKNKSFGGLSNILNSGKFTCEKTTALNQTVRENVKKVFCDNKKYWKDCIALDFIAIKPTLNEISTTDNRDEKYERIGIVDSHVYWGKKQSGSTVKYSISDSNGTTNISVNGTEVETVVSYESITLTEDNVKYFGEPVIVKTDYLKAGNFSDFCENKLNSGTNIFNTSFCDMHQYSCKGRLVRAFPTYLFCVLDDQSQWYDGKKLWTNYYTHKSVIDIAVHSANDMPVETATITVSNAYHNLDSAQGGLDSYDISNDANNSWDCIDAVTDLIMKVPGVGNIPVIKSINEQAEQNKNNGYSWLTRFIYDKTGLLIGLGPKLTSQLIKLHQVIYSHVKLREGARVHLRMGYGSDPLSLAPVMNGHISDVTLGEQISIVVTSDGNELISHVTSTNEKNATDTNAGWLGLFGLGEAQESSNIIAKIMVERQSWVTHLMKSTFEGSKYSIEHYGLYFNQTNPADVYNEAREHYDILKNIYVSDYKPQRYVQGNFFDIDGEQNVVFNQYNMTPWDVFQVCTQQVPEYILKSSYHQFDSRLYFGLPCFMENFRYDLLTGKDGDIYEESKAATQCFYIDSISSIIDNQVRVTSKHTYTNIKVMYTKGNTVTPTSVIHSDDTIDFSYQKTTIMDSPIVQDALGPDAIYEFFGLYTLGKKSARRIGISTLLYGWQQQYQGEILLMGMPGLKPNDYLLVNDSFCSLYGVCFAREVIHSFNTSTGFTTSVVPGMLSFSTEENSGMIVNSQNMLSLLNIFASLSESRRELISNSEYCLSILSNLELLKNKYVTDFTKQVGVTNDIYDGIVSNSGIILTTYRGISTYKILNKIGLTRTITSAIRAKNIAPVVTACKNTLSTFTTAFKGVNGIKSALQALKTSVTTVAGSATGGTGAIVSLVIFQVVDTLLSSFFEWLSNRNVVCLLPLWWESYPFVSNVKDGENILLMPNNATSTDENNREDSISLE